MALPSLVMDRFLQTKQTQAVMDASEDEENVHDSGITASVMNVLALWKRAKAPNVIDRSTFLNHKLNCLVDNMISGIADAGMVVVKEWKCLLLTLMLLLDNTEWTWSDGLSQSTSVQYPWLLCHAFDMVVAEETCESLVWDSWMDLCSECFVEPRPMDLAEEAWLRHDQRHQTHTHLLSLVASSQETFVWIPALPAMVQQSSFLFQSFDLLCHRGIVIKLIEWVQCLAPVAGRAIRLNHTCLLQQAMIDHAKTFLDRQMTPSCAHGRQGYYGLCEECVDAKTKQLEDFVVGKMKTTSMGHNQEGLLLKLCRQWSRETVLSIL